jgi:uncharacterized protein (UPF0128 family)
MKSSYNQKVVTAFFASEGIPEPEYEFKFHATRKWRFDLAWKRYTDGGKHLAVEVQGGIWSGGRHNRGAAMLKEWEKLNEAAAAGWRIMYCQPSDLCTVDFARLVKRALNL